MLVRLLGLVVLVLFEEVIKTLYLGTLRLILLLLLLRGNVSRLSATHSRPWHGLLDSDQLGDARLQLPVVIFYLNELLAHSVHLALIFFTFLAPFRYTLT